jgi:Fe2+ or Zn2+ uptake regulation protein
MESIVIDKTLRLHHIRPTNIRRSIFMILQEKNYALSQTEIATELSDKFDRVTIYRTLNKFLENGLIHKIIDEQISNTPFVMETIVRLICTMMNMFTSNVQNADIFFASMQFRSLYPNFHQDFKPTISS